ncbi:MAG TPA: hypothetical protein VK623_06835 [Flavobacterium sp.]|nr:hypothetical protein [Flavobacterium sp.]
MRKIAFILFIGVLISMSSCRKDFDFESSTGGLRFSRDTVYLDTVFTNIGSSTYTLKVYNRSDKDINIPSVKLGKGLDSKYRMTVDGMQGNGGKNFENVELLANDSLYIFIETTANIADANPTDFLYTDQIQFDSGTKLQTVELVTLIQDAVFLYPQRFDDGTTETLPIGDDQIYGFYLDHADHGDEFHFTNAKPYVIYGYAAVPNGETLTIDPGARIFCHDGSGIIVGNGGNVVVGADNPTPTPESEVVFEGDRLEPDFSDIPGQWGAIWLTPGSTGSFNHTTIKNAVIGLYTQANTVSIKNTQIYDCSNYGILAQTATITGENVIINSAGQRALACSLGGNYNFTHCTFNNNWPSSKQVAVSIDNYFLDENGTEFPYDLTAANFTNCIIFGSNQVELLINQGDSTTVTWNEPVFTKCQIKFNNTANQFTDNPHYTFLNDDTNIIKNQNPDFEDGNKNKLNIGDDSNAQDFGNFTTVTHDILGTLRVAGPTNGKYDLGAYQHATFPEDN